MSDPLICPTCGRHEPCRHCPSPVDAALLEEAIARFMECVDVNEGVWFVSQWPDFGITDEMAALLKNAWTKHYDTPNTP